jgi:hypothetical protein
LMLNFTFKLLSKYRLRYNIGQKEMAQLTNYRH